MINFLAKRRVLVIGALLIVLIVAASLCFDVRDICAHTPHDPIDALELSPTYSQDETLFVIISDHILRSTDGGFSWKELVNDLDNMQFFTSIAISPSYDLDRTLFVASVGDGVYRSQDGGDSWVNVSNGLGNSNVGLLSIHPGYRSDGIVLAAGAEGGLDRTENGGDSWHQVIDSDCKITAIAFSPDLDQDQVIAGDQEGTLYRSTDGGEVWQQVFHNPDVGAITAAAISPSFSSDGTFFVGTESGGIFRTTDGGTSFEAVNKGLRFTTRGKYFTFRKSAEGPAIRRDEKAIVSLAISPDFASDSTVFASMWNEAVFRSDNAGKTWKKYPTDLTCDSQADSDEYRSPHFRALRISNDFRNDGTIFLAGFDGLFKSTDGGLHWPQMETLPLGLIKGLALSPGNKDNLSCGITTYGGGIYVTYDQGDTWVVANKGLDTTRISDIDFSPGYPTDNVVFAASRGYLLRSMDRGNEWNRIALDQKSWRTRIISGLTILWDVPYSLRKMVLSETELVSPFATVITLSPDFPSDDTIYFGTRRHGVFKSVDGGRSASIVWDAMDQTVTALVIAPGDGPGRTLFAGIHGMGVYRTVDGGDTWQAVDNGLTFVETWRHRPTVYDIARDDILLEISPGYETDQTVFAGCSEGLFKTTDGGQVWEELEGGYVIGMAISPDYENDGTFVVSVKGEGLFKSDDGGLNFGRIGADLIDDNHAIEYLAFSAAYDADNTIYAASDEKLFKSTDGGDTWEMIARPVRYENVREVVHYEGEWETSWSDEYSASSVSSTDTAGDKVSLGFVGTGVTWIGTEADDQGIARVYVDGDYVGDVDQFGHTRRLMVPSFSISGLARGPHTIVVEVTDTRNSESTGYRVEVDAFDIAP